MNVSFFDRLLHFLGIRPNMALVLANFNQVSADLDAVVAHQTKKKLKAERTLALATETAARAQTVSTNMKALLGN